MLGATSYSYGLENKNLSKVLFEAIHLWPSGSHYFTNVFHTSVRLIPNSVILNVKSHPLTLNSIHLSVARSIVYLLHEQLAMTVFFTDRTNGFRLPLPIMVIHTIVFFNVILSISYLGLGTFGISTARNSEVSFSNLTH